MAFGQCLYKAFHLLDTTLLGKKTLVCCRLLRNLKLFRGLGSVRHFAVTETKLVARTKKEIMSPSGLKLMKHRTCSTSVTPPSLISSKQHIERITPINFNRHRFLLQALKGPLSLNDWICISESLKDDLEDLNSYDSKQLVSALSTKTDYEVVRLFIAALNAESSSYKLLTAFENFLCQWNVLETHESILCVLEYCLMVQTKYECNKLRSHFFLAFSQNFSNFENVSPSFISRVCLVGNWYSSRSQKCLTLETMHKIKKYTMKHYDHFSLEEIVPILNTYTYQKYVLPVAYLKAMANVINEILMTKLFLDVNVDNTFLLIILQFFRGQKFSPNKILLQISEYLARPEQHYRFHSIQFMSKIICTYASHKTYHEKLFQVVVDILKKDYYEFTEFRLKDVAHLLWSFSFGGFTYDSHPELYKVLIRMWCDIDRDHKRYREQQSTVDMLYSCALAGVFPWDIIRKEFTDKKILRATESREGYVSRIFQPLVIQTCLEVEFPAYQGKLTQTTVKKLISEDTGAAQKADLERYSTVVKKLQDIFGSDCIHSPTILPFCILPCIQVWIDKRTNVPISFTPEPYTTLLKNLTLNKAEHSDVRKVVLLLLSKRQHNWKSQEKPLVPGGYQLMRKRLLTKLGFQVFFILRYSDNIIDEIECIIRGGEQSDQPENSLPITEGYQD